MSPQYCMVTGAYRARPHRSIVVSSTTNQRRLPVRTARDRSQCVRASRTRGGYPPGRSPPRRSEDRRGDNVSLLGQRDRHSCLGDGRNRPVRDEIQCDCSSVPTTWCARARQRRHSDPFGSSAKAHRDANVRAQARGHGIEADANASEVSLVRKTISDSQLGKPVHSRVVLARTGSAGIRTWQVVGTSHGSG